MRTNVQVYHYILKAINRQKLQTRNQSTLNSSVLQIEKYTNTNTARTVSSQLSGSLYFKYKIKTEFIEIDIRLFCKEDLQREKN